MTEQDDDDDKHDVIVDSWMKRLREGNPVWFEEKYNEDVAARSTAGEDVAGPQNLPAASNTNPVPPHHNELQEIVNALKREMAEGFNKIHERLKSLEDYQNLQRAETGEADHREEETNKEAGEANIEEEEEAGEADNREEETNNQEQEATNQVEESNNPVANRRSYTKKCYKRQRNVMRSPVVTRQKRK